MFTKQCRIAITTAICLVLSLTVACAETDTHAEMGVVGEIPTPEEGSIAADYPQLIDSPLGGAMITDLPEDVLLRAGEVTVTQEDIDQQLEMVPEENRHMFEGNNYFIAEQVLSEKLLVDAAKAEVAEVRDDIDQLSDEEIMQTFFMQMTEDIEVTEQEVVAFYQENQQMMGGMELEQAAPQIENFIRQQRQQEVVGQYVDRQLRQAEIEASQDWVRDDVSQAMDNAIDKGRASGKPSLGTFVSAEDPASQQLITILDEMEGKYEGEAEINYVPVNEKPILAARYEIQDVPTLIFFDIDGHEVMRHTGSLSQQEIAQQLQLMTD